MNGLKGIIMTFHSWVLLLVLSLFSLRLFAQEATEEAAQGWPVVERCVGEPITPPADWSFEGTILATGWAGIHGINAEWETPRILIFQDDWYQWGTGLSPDSEWYAVIQYDLIDGFPRDYVRTYGLKVYSTRDRELSYFYPIEASEEAYTFWLDNEHLIYRVYDNAYRINAFTGETVDYQGMVNERMLIADDTQFAVFSSYNTIEWYFVNLSNNEIGFVEWNGYPTRILPDSEFIIVHRREEIEGESYSETGSVVLLSQNGELIDTIYVGNTAVSGLYASLFYLTHGLSNDGRYYAFVPVEETSSRTGILHIADMQEHIVVKTCISTIDSGLAWSPSENKLVVAYSEYGQQPLQILDLDLWQVYLTNQYHNGNIIGWRAD
jgi:hypothetical protein